MDAVLGIAEQLAASRLYQGMVRSELQPALPQVEEDTARLAAHVAWKNGREQMARRWFVDYLSISSTSELDSVDQQIRDEILASKVASRERLELFRAKRQLTLVKTAEDREAAAASLKRVWQDPGTPADVRAEAGYTLAEHKRMQPDRREILAILNEVIELAGDSRTGEMAVFLRGQVHNRERSKGDSGKRDVTAFRRDMKEVIRRSPQGDLADDALEKLSADYLFEGDLENARLHYRMLREFSGNNDFVDTAYVLPAIGLIGRGSPEDLTEADDLLQQYVERYPEGLFRQRATFWRGRISERRGETESARLFFQQVIDLAPYDYYAIRARMHLEEGAAARSGELFSSESATALQLREARRASRVDTDLETVSPYHARLGEAVESGLYAEVLSQEGNLTQRQDNMTLKELDARNLLPATGVLLSLRQDALAARDVERSPRNRLELAGLLGHQVGDWPVAIDMTTDRADEPQRVRSEVQKDDRFLAAAYPVVFANLLQKHSWPIDGSRGLSQSLMYAVMRHESRFYDRAISGAGALGLFQFLPLTFRNLDRRWGLLEKVKGGGVETGTEYLLDPGRNLALWARWAREEFRLRHREGISEALMKHHAGSGNVDRWREYWETVGAVDDVEYRIETARFNKTRSFVRRVLTDVAIVDAADFSKPAEPEQ